MLKKLALASAALTASISLAFAGDLENKSWDEIVAQAKEEGQVAWYVWYLRDDLRNAVKPFEEEYGIKVTIPEGTNQGNQDKLLAERDREEGDIDVMALGYDAMASKDMEALFMDLSGYLPKDDDRVGSLVGIDPKGRALAFWGNQTGIAYDPAKVDASALPQTPTEFAEFWASNPGKFGFNFEKGGSGPSFHSNVMRNLSDVDFSSPDSSPEKLAKLKPGIEFFNEHGENYVITASNADSIIRVSDGELWMVPAWEDHLAGLQKRGEVRSDIKFYIPAMGMSGGGNGVSIPNNARNKAAALVFINWLTSADTQSAFNRDFGTAPMHGKADDSYALVSNDQRAHRVDPAKDPFYKELKDHFIENVILNR
ncbi:extracellular solute-binding protein [Nitratireductor sp. XY-223]|uniref:extracellular solute-binding protein n=1 Tax=Nitratireductor sp. XY-223 TaxID=2561926 RepID=UPI0010AA5470|nr:extracellular solute-binding protein [Nitratireductor sp. XY-223]